MNIFRLFILSLSLILFYSQQGFAYTITVSSKAKIGDNVRIAYHNSIESALIGSIRAYYKNKKISDVKVTNKYKAFIKSYKIASQSVNDGYVFSTLVVTLDDTALQDASILLSQHSDSVVYSFSGMPKDIIPTDTQRRIILSTLNSKQFSTQNQSTFLELMDKNNNIAKSLLESGSSYFFEFNFQPLSNANDFIDTENKCEVITNLIITSKQDDTKTLTVTTGSKNNTLKYCYSESMEQAVNIMISKVRNEVITLPESSAKLVKYSIKLIKPRNMVLTNTLMETLAQRGLIKSSKATSFSQNLVVFEVESFFSQEELSKKIQSLNLEEKPKIIHNDKEVILDFSEG